MKVLLITNEVKTITILTNYINLNIKNIIILVANDIKSAKLILSEHTINVIICDSKIYNINYQKHFAFIPILLIHNLNNAYSPQNLKCFSIDNLSVLSSYLQNFMVLSTNIKDSKDLIYKHLMQIGFNIKHNGTKYIAESIILLKYYCKVDYMKDIYSIIARKHNTTSNNIKSNILKSINYMYCETDFSVIQKYFSLIDDIKPTPKQIILTVLKNI